MAGRGHYGTWDKSDLLLKACRECNSDLVIVSPFIKVGAFDRVVDAVKSETRITVVTRWRIDEIASGISDLAVFDRCCARTHCQLLVLDSLHAKYYRAGNVVMIGSANLTLSGMGWADRPNVEILHELACDDLWLDWEALLIGRASVATAAIRDAMEHAVDQYASDPAVLVQQREGPPLCAGFLGDGAVWVPRSRSPEGAVLYCVGKSDLLTDAAREDAASDVRHLNIPSCRDENACRACVRAAVMQQPFVAVVDRLIWDRPRFGLFKRRVREAFPAACVGRSDEEIAQNIMRWLAWFWPDQYRVRVYRYSEYLEKLGP